MRQSELLNVTTGKCVGTSTELATYTSSVGTLVRNDPLLHGGRLLIGYYCLLGTLSVRVGRPLGREGRALQKRVIVKATREECMRC